VVLIRPPSSLAVASPGRRGRGDRLCRVAQLLEHGGIECGCRGGEHDPESGDHRAVLTRDRNGDGGVADDGLLVLGRQRAVPHDDQLLLQRGRVGDGVAGQVGQGTSEHLRAEVVVVGEQHLSEGGGVRREGDAGLGHLLGAVGTAIVVDDEDVGVVRDTQPRCESGAMRQVVHAPQRPRAHVEGVEVHARG
jgi:hypothetical protein